MSDWGGPYVAAMLPLTDGPDDPIVGAVTDAGTLRTIRGIGTRGSVPRLGSEFAARCLIILWAGRQRGTGMLTLTVAAPDGTISPPAE